MESRRINERVLITITGTWAESHAKNWMECEMTWVSRLRKMGFDVVYGDQIVIKDATQQALESFLSEHREEDLKLVLSPIGGQGHLIGRGNQQLSPTVLRLVGRERIVVVATKTKLQGLQGRPLLIDSNDRALDIEWEGYIPVTTGYRDQVLYALNSG